MFNSGLREVLTRRGPDKVDEGIITGMEVSCGVK